MMQLPLLQLNADKTSVSTVSICQFLMELHVGIQVNPMFRGSAFFLGDGGGGGGGEVNDSQILLHPDSWYTSAFEN